MMFRSGLLALASLALFLSGCANPKISEMHDKIAKSVEQDAGLAQTYLGLVVEDPAGGKLLELLQKTQDVIKKASDNRSDLQVYLKGVDSGLKYVPRDAISKFYDTEQKFEDSYSRCVDCLKQGVALQAEYDRAPEYQLGSGKYGQETPEQKEISEQRQALGSKFKASCAEGLTELDELMKLEPETQKALKEAGISQNLAWSNSPKSTDAIKQLLNSLTTEK